MRNRAQHVLDGVDGLMNEDLAHGFFLLLVFVVVRGTRRVLLGFGVLPELHSLIDIAVASHVRFTLSGELDVEGFTQKEDWNAYEGKVDEDLLELGLAVEHVHVASRGGFLLFEEHHVDEVDEDGGGARRSVFDGWKRGLAGW